jgi:sugar phosphate isomerase/epimerase
MRRMAFLKLAGTLGLRLAAAMEILGGTPQDRRRTAQLEIERLDDLIDRARSAGALLINARDCPHAHPASRCPSMTQALDHLIDAENPKGLRDTIR